MHQNDVSRRVFCQKKVSLRRRKMFKQRFNHNVKSCAGGVKKASLSNILEAQEHILKYVITEMKNAVITQF